MYGIRLCKLCLRDVVLYFNVVSKMHRPTSDLDTVTCQGPAFSMWPKPPNR